MNRRTFLKTFTTVLLTQGMPVSNIIRASDISSASRNSPGAPSPVNPLDRHQHPSNASNHIQLPEDAWPELRTTFKRFSRIQATVGYGNFCLIGFDDSLKIARSYANIGAFTDREMAFLETLYYTDARGYGFLGKKTFHNISDIVPASKTHKIPGTGNYLFDGRPRHIYKQITHDIGDQVVLTAGIRGMAKQFYLFLGKVKKTSGNLSLASRSIAPPGYSYHGIGDFDVGKTGFGVANFTIRFSQTSVYRKMTQLDYILFRYPQNNHLGVQFEPWHIQIV